ncbi:MAG TPA: ABC transporter permease [Hypericibacter adhaerens]|jgi:putative spermidine/putrescine transport system permease protein|uniref:ABC transporter permease n=1 Tax=Hypericibacter adhaerens TaxID=2602016 RepID=A0A5J6MYY3_9PROT|nr:ABC transporter permease [Hypericibacter adhaerens]QEX21490.1 ABC transporter permease [Hypericibacter adhaerens]HWA45648.1 ABC transporter permease [Hypericibacter adhaerens]
MSERYGWRFGVVLAATWLVLMFLVLPIFVSAPISLTPERFLTLPKDAVTLRNYENLVTNPNWTSSIWQSLVVAVVSTLISTTLGTLCAIGLWRIASRWSELVRGFVLLPIIVPSIVSALAFYRIFVDLRLLDSYPGIILAHTVLSVPYVVITVSTSLANFDLRLEQAARNLGADMKQTLRMVILPCIAPGVLAGAVFAFISSWDEIVVTLFITKLNIFTLPRRMWDGIRDQADPTIAACATTLIFITILVIGSQMWLRARRLKAQSQAETAA